MGPGLVCQYQPAFQSNNLNGAIDRGSYWCQIIRWFSFQNIRQDFLKRKSESSIELLESIITWPSNSHYLSRDNNKRSIPLFSMFFHPKITPKNIECCFSFLQNSTFMVIVRRLIFMVMRVNKLFKLITFFIFT